MITRRGLVHGFACTEFALGATRCNSAHRFGETADTAGDYSDTRLVAGVRLWF